MGKAQELIVNERIAPSDLPRTGTKATLSGEKAGKLPRKLSSIARGLVELLPKATLTAQAAAFDAIFTELARRGALNLGEYLSASETYLRLALKAQSQCRATLETLAEIKNPHPVAFVQQANIAHGPQQVNNGAESRAREKVI